MAASPGVSATKAIARPSPTHPEIYMPRYGGHDPVAVGRGIARPGHPDFWAIHDKKLFLFYSEDAKMEFELDPAVAILQAEANWPHVRETLAP